VNEPPFFRGDPCDSKLGEGLSTPKEDCLESNERMFFFGLASAYRALLAAWQVYEGAKHGETLARVNLEADVRALFLFPVLALFGCAHSSAVTGSSPKSVRLLAETLERETTQLQEVRADLEVDTTDFERTPRVVATGETPLLTADGGDAFLYGDEGATTGFAVDNCIFLEVLSSDGKPLRSVVIGSVPGLSQGKERIDSLGPNAFQFAPGEVQLTSILPESGAFKLRATVLDYGGVGRVTDVWVRFVSKARSADDLRER
jgi:hypothetical protein